MSVRTSSAILVGVAMAISFVACHGDAGRGDGKERRIDILPASEIHEGWYFASGDIVSIEGTVNGDVYAAGGRVDVSGTVNGDLLIAGGQVTVTGVVSDDIRAAGGTVRIDGKVGKNITAAGGNIVIGRPATIRGSVIALGGEVQSSGLIQGSAMFLAGSSEVTGTLEGDLAFKGGQLTVLPGASVLGNLTASAEKEKVNIAEGTVRGNIKIISPEEKEIQKAAGGWGFTMILKLLWTGALLVTGLVFFLLFRNLFVRYATTVRHRAMMSLLWGFAAILLLPVVMIILGVTIVGLPLALLIMDLYFWLAFFSQLSLALLAGDIIFRNMQGSGWAPFWSYLVGLILVQLLALIPYLCWLLFILGLIWGFGALILLVGDAWTAKRTAAAHD